MGIYIYIYSFILLCFCCSSFYTIHCQLKFPTLGIIKPYYNDYAEIWKYLWYDTLTHYIQHTAYSKHTAVTLMSPWNHMIHEESRLNADHHHMFLLWDTLAFPTYLQQEGPLKYVHCWLAG